MPGHSYEILAIVAFPHKKGLVSIMAQRVLDGAASNGRHMELMNLYAYSLEQCRGCWACTKKGRWIDWDGIGDITSQMMAMVVDFGAVADPEEFYRQHAPRGLQGVLFAHHTSQEMTERAASIGRGERS